MNAKKQLKMVHKNNYRTACKYLKKSLKFENSTHENSCHSIPYWKI